MPLCDHAVGIFGAEGGGEAQGRAAVVEISVSLISPDINLRLHPAPPPPSPSCYPSSVSVSKSRLWPPLGCVWLVTSSFPKWLVLHEVSVCMMCWVSIFISYFIFSCHLCFFYNCIYMTVKGLWHVGAWSAVYMGMLSPTCSCFKSPIALGFLSIVYDVQNVAATAALCWSRSEKLEPLQWVCHHY